MRIKLGTDKHKTCLTEQGINQMHDHKRWLRITLHPDVKKFTEIKDDKTILIAKSIMVT